MDPEVVSFLIALLRSLAFVVLYFIVGFGPGFVAGLTLANRLFGRGHPTYMEIHKENIVKAIEHNRQWHPDNEKWQK